MLIFPHYANLSTLFKRNEENIMDDFKTKILQAREILILDMYKSIESFSEIFDDSGPRWVREFRDEKLRFMKEVFIETVMFDFREDEINKIVDSCESFIDICWDTWNNFGGSIKETIKETVECFAQGLYDYEGVDDYEKHCT